MNLSNAALKDYLRSIRYLEAIPLLSSLSLIMSVLFTSRLFRFPLLNFVYMINVAFFVFLINESRSSRKVNGYPFIASILSIVLSTITLWQLASGWAN